MECSWDRALLARGDQLPTDLLETIRNGGHEQYLDAITRATLDPRYTYTLFSLCEDIFAHVCANLRNHGNLASAIATLGRIIPFAPYLSPYAEQLLAAERYQFSRPDMQLDDTLYLLGLFRLCSSDWRTFGSYADATQISQLLRSPSRPIVYLSIRILQLYLQGADNWFESMMKQHLGEDSPESAIDGIWDDLVIDYRFLTLWEHERHDRVRGLIADVSQRAQHSFPEKPRRIIPHDRFHSSVAVIGGIALPRERASRKDEMPTRLVETPTTSRNLKAVADALKHSKPLLLTGLAGSGKSMLIRHLATVLGKLDKMVTLHLNEQSDAKLLIGVYTTGEKPGSFVWKPGVLATAVREGRWIVIEDLDRAPNEVIGALLPLIERGELFIPSRKQTIKAAQGFRIISTIRTTTNPRGYESSPLSHMLGARLWRSIRIEMPPLMEQREVAETLFPSLSALLPQFIDAFSRLQTTQARPNPRNQDGAGTFRTVSPRDLLKWCRRTVNFLQDKRSFTSHDVDNIFLEAVDCFLGALSGGSAKQDMAALIAEVLQIDPQRRDYLLTERDAQYAFDKNTITAGRYRLHRASQTKKNVTQDSTFSTNPHTSRMLERVAAAVLNHEPLLLVGETGVGKTTAVQHLAGHLGKKLVPFNLSQQSEAGDLLGGFKPVNARSLIVPMQDEFDDLFTTSFSKSKNQDFLDLLGKQLARSNWKAVCKLWQRALKMVEQQRLSSTSTQGEAPSKKRKVESKRTVAFDRWAAFSARVTDMENRLAHGTEAFAFSFVEGGVVKAVRNGDWILLDEINLASMDTLESIADLLDPSSPSILLTEAGQAEKIDAHPDFRVFAAMNPATDVGKKDLPPGIRSRFTELYVESPDKDIRSLQSIVRSYLRHESATDQAIPLDVSNLYQKIVALSEQNKLVDGAGQKPHFSLRTLTRTLNYAKYIAPLCSLRRALFEGFQMSFLTFLDQESSRLVHPFLEQHMFGKRTNIRGELQKALRKPTDGRDHVLGWPGSKHWVRKGELPVEDQSHYILTPFIRNNIENLVRATSTRQFPVLVQGPTSSGKTSMIEYLAKRTGHKFVRINNHEHTDLQEYLGTYVSGADGKLQFQEGILVRALREGHWIVLDELNLAPTDVLEALNRLLDDNRELLIPETQEIVRPHQDFMLFATQNPAGLYGGRKTLSRAFRNRFLELHFDDIPIDELQEILHRRTQLPESRCKRIVAVYREVSVLRQESRLFEQKSFATLRDLFRWALRPSDTVEELAANGFMLLAERVRKSEERQVIKEVIEKAMSAKGPRVSIDEGLLYARDCQDIQRYQQSTMSHSVVWTKAMRRLYVLVSRAMANDEPVLLVGETGCGKTTVCQMLADTFGKQLHTVNAHQNTETGDLIGSQRPIRNRAVIEAGLRQQLLASTLLESQSDASGLPTDGLLAAYDRGLSALSAGDQAAISQSPEHAGIQVSRVRFHALFEWADGSLVQAMKDGAYFLLDEISLADDSVLERLNSVLESERSILLAEKGSLDSFVQAKPGFQFLATMNPGGDYGKRELSPALRNRFTEIWVPSLNDAEDVAEIVTARLVDSARPFTNAIVAFATWFKEQYNTSASSSVSIRDALAWVDFINAKPTPDLRAAVVHGAAMVYIDTLGANPAGLMTMTRHSLEEEREACLTELGRQLHSDVKSVYGARTEIRSTEDHFLSGDFSIAKRSSGSPADLGFSFDPPTTKINAMRIVRALHLPKPVMLEGNPGVGKTALITAIAEAVSVTLTRINLSEQTDLIDLFGSDVPVEGAETGSFTWRDAPFLRAMKNGEWVLLDEMNLASQSVLEGLNACLDHRGEVYVPELGQAFTRHPAFRLFAAQNPHHQGGGRKGLPASFVNRFNVVYADAFKPGDLLLICRRRFPALDDGLIANAVEFVGKLEREFTRHKRFGANGGPWEFNLRDVSRWLALASSDRGLLKAGTANDFVDFLFSQRFRTSSDRADVAEIFGSVFGDPLPRSDLFPSVSTQAIQFGLGLLPRNSAEMPCLPSLVHGAASTRHPRVIESIMLCLQQSWPVILTGSSGSGKTAVIEQLASVVGAPLVTIAMNAETDAMDLVGGFEQHDPQRSLLQTIGDLRGKLLAEIRNVLVGGRDTTLADLLRLSETVDRVVSSEQLDIDPLVQGLQSPGSLNVSKELKRLQTRSAYVDKARFEWIDGVLVEALQEGKWLVLDNANLCSSSVLDRLNSLLEPNGSLIINEHSTDDGAARVIHPHPSFRIFLTLDPRYGELSRAMRNRAVELHLSKIDDICLPACPDHLFPESAVARLRNFEILASSGQSHATESAAMLLDHLAASDQSLVSRFKRQLETGLYGGLQGLRIPDAAMHPELVPRAHSFSGNLISQLQGPADFANVQTLHPLNNQPLICMSPHALSHASTLAVMFDLQVDVAPMHQLLSTSQSNLSLVKQLRRAEQKWEVHQSSDSRIKGSRVLAMSQQILVCFTSWAQSPVDIPAHSLQSARLLIDYICVVWRALHDAVASGHVDQAKITSFLTIADKAVCDGAHPEQDALSALLSQLSIIFRQFLQPSRETQGIGCVALWQAMRPTTPSTIAQAQDLLQFEALVDRFDALSQTSRMSLEHAADLRLQLAQALRVAKRGGRDLAALTERLQSLGLRLQETVDADAGLSRSSHFLLTFQQLLARLAGTKSAVTMARLDLAKLEISAHNKTARSQFCLENQQRAVLAQRSRHDLSSAAAAETSGDTVFALISSADQVSLGQLDSFAAQVQLLGKAISSQAHILSGPELIGLDQCLTTALSEILTALQDSQDSRLTAMASAIVSRNVSTSMNAALPAQTSSDWIPETLSYVRGYLSCAVCEPPQALALAASAWTSFALAALHLYVPGQAFDPALEPLIRLELYKRQHRGLRNKLEALRTLRQALVGETGSMRARIIEEDLEALGPEPQATTVCRPEVSELSKLQSEFDALMRTLEPLRKSFQPGGPAKPMDVTTLANLDRTRSRLETQYRAYDDFTDPVVFFIDCLLLGNDLATRSKASVGGKQTLASITPFVDASADSWFDDGVFLQAAQASSTAEDEIDWLQAISLRCKVRPLGKCSIGLRDRVDLAFQRLHALWKAELSADQKKNAAKSSLYKFRGNDDAEAEPTVADLDELFPSGDNAHSAGASDFSAAPMQGHAPTVAKLHALIYGAPASSQQDALELLRHWISRSSAEPLKGSSGHLLPATILGFGELNDSVSANPQPRSEYNMYTDSNAVESAKLFQLLQRIELRFTELQKAWPEHATPGDVLLLCSQILALPHSVPLPRLFPLLEKLHATVTEWQKIASREYSAASLLDDLTNTIIAWRQLELSTWAGVLDREWHQCERTASSWWFVAYDSVVAAVDGVEVPETEARRHTEGLLTTLSSFMSASGLGEFAARLRLLRGFEAELARSGQEDSVKPILHAALQNFVAFYTHFEKVVSDALEKGRSDLDKEAKSIIQLASWKDRNIDVLRQSAQSSHRKLLKLIKKYRTLLAQPVTAILQGGLPAIDSAKASPVLKSATVDMGLPVGIDDNTDLSVWDKRADRFRNATRTAGLMQSKTQAMIENFTGQEQLQDFTAQLVKDIASLQKATPSLLTEDNKTLVNHLKTRKRRLFAEALREVRAMGFQASLSTQALSMQESTDRVLSQLPKFPELASRSGVDSNTYELHRLLDIMPTARQSARSHSDDLTPAEVSRSMILLESMLQQSVLQYCNLNAHLSAALFMQKLAQMLKDVAMAEGLTNCKDRSAEAVAGSLDSIMTILPVCARILQHQSSMAGHDYSQLVSSLFECETQTQQLRSKLAALPRLPADLTCEEQMSVRAEYESLKQGINDIVKAATARHPETEPVTAQLFRWTTSTAIFATRHSENGHTDTNVESWTARLFDLADQMLICMQNLDKKKAAPNSENAWLSGEQGHLNDALQSLRVPAVCSSLELVLAELPHVQGHPALKQTVHISRSVLPIVQSYAQAVQTMVITQSNMHGEAAKTAFKLAQSFTTLCQKGFCTPSDKSQDKDSSEGNVESGTGLGDGEGAEDISKDIAPDEDLSELAQEAKRENDGDEIQEEKDAVDMADEDFEGEAGDSGEQQNGEDGEGPEDDAEGQEEMDEESREVDDQGSSTVDEKMWDSGKDESRRDKETDEAAGEKNDDNVTAGREDAKDADGGEDEQAEEDDGAGAETEDVQRDVADQVDPHTREDENLDLPEDMNMDQQKDAENDEPDLQSVSDIDESMSQAGADPQQEEAVADDNEATEEGDPNGEAQDGEEAADQDASSDILMRDDEQQSANEEPPKDTAAPPEAGNGPDQSDSREEGATQARSSGHQSGDQRTERDAEDNGSEDQEASGAGAEEGAPPSQEDHAQQERLPFKQIGDALHKWYNQNADIEKARQPDQTEEAGDATQQPAPTEFEHLPNADAQADAQALGTAAAEDSMALDKEQALPVNDEKEPERLPFQETAEEPSEDANKNQAEGAQLEPSDSLHPETSSNAFVGEPQGGDVDMLDGPEKSDEDDVDDVDQRLLQTHISQDQAADGLTIDEARTQWAAHEESTRNLAMMLTEHLRLILQPTQATKMRGDFRTGKRLNIKRIIPYIASSYKRDKIWMRRSVPSKRAYQIMLAIDDSQSMMESESRHLAFETLAMVTKSLSMLEVGELSVVGFGEEVRVAHDFNSPFTSDAGAEIFKRLSFSQSKTNVRKLLAESIEMFRSARLKASSSASDLWQLQLIVSDGICEDHPSIRQLVRQAHEERIMVVFIVVDAAAQSKAAEKGTKQSILDLQTAEFAKDSSGEMQLKMVKYLDTFPFAYYLIVRDVQELPGVLAGALRQWFSEVVETSS